MVSPAPSRQQQVTAEPPRVPVAARCGGVGIARAVPKPCYAEHGGAVCVRREGKAWSPRGAHLAMPSPARRPLRPRDISSIAGSAIKQPVCPHPRQIPPRPVSEPAPLRGAGP